MMTVSRLLKSCAMPPVSWPIASIFCACASCALSRSFSRCARLRSAMSKMLPRIQWCSG